MESAPSSLVGLDPQLPSDVISASAAPGSHWAPEKAVYGTASTNDIAVTGAGGTTIRVNEIYPTTASGQPAKGPFPVLLTMTPYGKGQGGSSAAGSASSPTSGAATGGADNYLVQRGYIEVVEDVRGTGDSNGSWGLFDPIQQRDAIKVLKWAAHLPNSNGKVGTYGPSYLGIDQLLLAGAVGKHSPLKAIFPMVPANDIYRDTSFMGGLLDFEFAETYLGLTGSAEHRQPAQRRDVGPRLLSDLAGVESDHVNGLASYHATATANILGGGDEALRRLLLAGAQPAERARARRGQPHPRLHGRRRVRHLPERRAGQLRRAAERVGRTAGPPRRCSAGQRTTGRYQLIVGPWEHLNGSSVDVDPLELEWFDTWLKGEKTGMARTPTPAALLRPGQRHVQRDLDLSVHGRDAHAPVLRRRAGRSPRRRRRAPARAVVLTDPGRCPLPGLPAAAQSDTLVWSPSGVPCGRSIDQWSMGGLSVPAGSAGFLAPCATDDRLAQTGPWATSYTSAPLTHAADARRPGHRHRVRERDHAQRPSSWPSSRRSRRTAPPIRSPRAPCSARCAR